MNDILLSIVFPLLFFYPFYQQYKIVQAYHYEINRYYIHTKNKNLKYMLFVVVFIIIKLLNDVILNYISSLFLLITLHLCMKEKKGKLVHTKRTKRVFVIYFLFNYFLCLLPINKIDLIIINCVLFLFNLFIVHMLSIMLENSIMRHYIRSAKKIIKNIKVIGITGSYGKTSCKNIIYDMLKSLFNVSKTPKSFNNKVGIVKSIRENVEKEDDYFICEYGVDRKNGMDKLLKIVKPNISIITEIGPQHLLTFKNIENIKNEKIKIAKVLKEDEYAIINNDNYYLNLEKDNLKCKVITYGIKNKSDIMAKNIITTSKGSFFDLYVDNKKYKTLKISLLGDHNILNVLGAIGVLKCIGVDLSNIKYLVSLINPIEHRLELKKIQGVNVIDDAFNSNEEGFKKAIDVLNLMEDKKYVITPGIIEQGKNSSLINYQLGKYMAGKIDCAILVESNALVIKKGLLDNGFEESKVIIKKDFKEAFEYIKEINTKDKIFLIENDLPSIYLK